MPASVSFFDMSATVSPPGGHNEPVPLLLGPNQQQNDIRMLFVSASGQNNDITLPEVMTPSPPTGFSAPYSLNPAHETQGAFYRRLVSGDTDTNVTFGKPKSWRHFMWSTLTARGVSPTVNPVAGALAVTRTVGATVATVASVSVPAAGTMVFCVGTVPDPESLWPSWASSLGAPTGWTNLVATDKSGSAYYSYDTNAALLVVAKNYSGAGSTGSISVPCTQGAPAFAGMYMFLQPAADVSVSLGAV